MPVLFIKLISSDRINMGAANSTNNNNNFRFFQPKQEKQAPKPFDEKSSEFVKDMSNPDNLTSTEKYIEKQKTLQPSGSVLNGKCSEHLNKINTLERKIKELEKSCNIKTKNIVPRARIASVYDKDVITNKDVIPNKLYNKGSITNNKGSIKNKQVPAEKVRAKYGNNISQVENTYAVEGFSNVDDNSFLFMLIGIVIIYRFMQK
jgi:hypothetical protein